ncbi:MAG: glycosyltransferase [Bacteroidota bacterium]
MRKAFVTFLATDDFLPGILALNYSLRAYNSHRDLVIMITDAISGDVIDILKNIGGKIKLVPDIANPFTPENDVRRFGCMYTKLHTFLLTDYDKVIYLDCDLLICANIEALFDAPHMSAVVAGGLVKENAAWTELNAGLLVIEPSQQLFDQIITAIPHTASKDGSDQGFLQTYYNTWPKDEVLHLPHSFNVPFIYLDNYCLNHGFSFSYTLRNLKTDIAIIHYWGAVKPWQIDNRTFSRRDKSRQIQAVLLWWDIFNNAVDKINEG